MTHEDDLNADTILALTPGLLIANLRAREALGVGPVATASAAADGIMIMEEILAVSDSPETALWGVAGCASEIICKLCDMLDLDVYDVLELAARVELDAGEV